MTLLNYANAIEHLNSQSELSHKTQKWGLENISSAIEELRLDLTSLHLIQVVGTNGKGGTAYFIHQILQCFGFKVGAYTKPHLCSVCERIRIQKLISEECFAKLYWQLLPVFEKFTLSYFEKLTLLALVYFIQEKTDFAVFETGLGGRLDAVTALHAATVVFTSIGIDHTEYLGNTIEQITIEKAEVLKLCQQAFSTIQTPPVRAVLQSIAQTYGKNVQFIAPIEHGELNKHGTHFRFQGQDFDIPMFGTHYAQNAALAIEVTQSLFKKTQLSKLGSVAITKQSEITERLKTALSTSFWKGRLEFIHVKGYNKVLLSCAHNEGALIADSQTIRQMVDKKILPKTLKVLFAASRQRPADKFMEILLNELQGLDLSITITLIPPYQYPYQLLKNSSYSNLEFIEDCEKAFAKVLYLDSGDVVLSIGSIYLCGMVLRYLSNENSYDA